MEHESDVIMKKTMSNSISAKNYTRKQVLVFKFGSGEIMKHSNGLAYKPGAQRFIQVNDCKRFDRIKTCTLTGTFKIFIVAWVDPGISPLNYPFRGTKNDICSNER